MLYLVTGGSGSGKSEYVEGLAVRLRERHPEGALYYVATMYPYDEECRRRIARHRLLRKDKGFSTLECSCNVQSIQPHREDVLLLECMSNLLANEMYRPEGKLKERGQKAAQQLEESIFQPLLRLAEQAGELVVVTNEVFSDGIRYDQESEVYRELLGKINAWLAARAAGVVEVVFTIPVIHKNTGEVSL